MLTDEERGRLAYEFKMAFLPRVDMLLFRLDDKAMECNAKAATFALDVVAFFEKRMPERCTCSKS